MSDQPNPSSPQQPWYQSNHEPSTGSPGAAQNPFGGPQTPDPYGAPQQAYGSQPGYGDQQGGVDPGYAPLPGQQYPAYNTIPGATMAAGLGERFVARILDGIITGVAVFLISLVIQGVLSGRIGDTVSTVVSALVAFGYFVVMETSSGQTVGKQAMKLTVQGAGGGKPSYEESAKRNVFMLASLLALLPLVGEGMAGLVGLVAVITIAVTINGDSLNRQGWHDKFAGTRVLKKN